MAAFKWQCGETQAQYEFGEWTQWNDCSESCGNGVTTRNRTCTAIENTSCPATGSCEDADTCVFESKTCEIKKCYTCANFGYLCAEILGTECEDVAQSDGEIMVNLIEIKSNNSIRILRKLITPRHYFLI